MKGLIALLRTARWDAALPLLYTGAVLTLFEYRLLPTAWHPRFREWMPEWSYAERDLWSGIAWAGSCGVLFLLLPLVLTLFAHRDQPSSIGWRLKGLPKHLPIYLGLYLVMLPAILWAAEDPEFLGTYPFVHSARTEWGHFWRWEIAYLLQFLALEAFFRGYLLFRLAKVMGSNAVFVAAVPYTMIHFHKPEAECFGALFAGVALGFLALRFRSFLGGAVLHALVAVTMDYLACSRAGLFN